MPSFPQSPKQYNNRDSRIGPRKTTKATNKLHRAVHDRPSPLQNCRGNILIPNDLIEADAKRKQKNRQKQEVALGDNTIVSLRLLGELRHVDIALPLFLVAHPASIYDTTPSRREIALNLRPQERQPATSHSIPPSVNAPNSSKPFATTLSRVSPPGVDRTDNNKNPLRKATGGFARTPLSPTPFTFSLP
jgi:hypothetical protein